MNSGALFQNLSHSVEQSTSYLANLHSSLALDWWLPVQEMLGTSSPSLSPASHQNNPDVLEIHSHTLNSVKVVPGNWSLSQEDMQLQQPQVSCFV